MSKWKSSSCEPSTPPSEPPCEPNTPPSEPCEPGCSGHGDTTTTNNGLINVGNVSALNGLHLLSDNVILQDIDVGGIANGALGNVLSGNTVGDVLSGNAIGNLTTNILSDNTFVSQLLSGNTTSILGVAESGDGDANGFAGIGNIFANVEHVLDLDGLFHG